MPLQYWAILSAAAFGSPNSKRSSFAFLPAMRRVCSHLARYVKNPVLCALSTPSGNIFRSLRDGLLPEAASAGAPERRLFVPERGFVAIFGPISRTMD